MIRNTENRYGLLAKALHWLMALGVFGLFGLGLYMVELSYYDSWYRGSLSLHKSLGLLMIALFVGRVLWRLFNPSPKALVKARWEAWLAHAMHGALYMVLLVLMVSGFLISTADGRGIEFFELFTVPALPWSVDNQEDLAGEIHEILAWSLISLAVLHVLAALKHHFIDHDNTLKRMLWFK